MTKKIQVTILEFNAEELADDNFHAEKLILENFTDWEEITQKEYQDLQNWVIEKNYSKSCRGSYPYKQKVVVASLPVKPCLQDYKNMMKAEKEKVEKDEERRKKAAITRKKNILKKKREQLEALKAELGEE